MRTLKLLCADEASLSDPGMIGLGSESLEGLEWLACVHDAEACRSVAARLPDSVGAWIISSDDMDAVNLAAALKHDDPGRLVQLVCFSPDGSLVSRASRAGIDGVLDELSFKKDFALWKGLVRPPLRMPRPWMPVVRASLRVTRASMPPKEASRLPGAQQAGRLWRACRSLRALRGRKARSSA